MEENIDYEKLREDLLDYFGSAIPINQIAIVEIARIESAMPSQLLNIAILNGFDITKYNLYKKNLKL